MSNSEQFLGNKEPESDAQQSLVEMVIARRGGTLKRAKRLLNPLDDHPYLQTVDLGPMQNSPVLKADMSAPFGRHRGTLDAQVLAKIERKHPGRADKVSEDLALQGIQLLEQIVSVPKEEEWTQPVNSLYTPESPEGLFRGIGNKSMINGLAADPLIATGLGVLQRVISKELFKPNLSPDQQKGLFAAAVGLAQSIAVERAKAHIEGKSGDAGLDLEKVQKRKIRRKHGVRDEVLFYAFRLLRIQEQPGLADYFVAQKVNQAEGGTRR